MRSFSTIIVLVLAVMTPASASGEEAGSGKNYFAVLGGFGASHPGWGDTIVQVRTLDAVFRYGRIITGEIGNGRFKFRHDMLIEIPAALIVKPGTNGMVGLSCLATVRFPSCLHSTPVQNLVPYIFAGGGPMYIFKRITGMARRGNGHYQGGLGVRYPVSDTMTVMVEGRFHHISNGGSKNPNYPLNSTKLLAGITIFQ